MTAAFRDKEIRRAGEVARDSARPFRYLRQEVTMTAGSQNLSLREIFFWTLTCPGAKAVGTVEGSPIVTGTFYLGIRAASFND
jgi:hypothetical protein